MRERIGTTRSNKPIELIWVFKNGVRKIKSFSRFDSPDDLFDFSTVCDARAHRFRRLEDKVAAYEAELLQSTAADIRRSIGHGTYEQISDQLGFRHSLDRLRHGQSLEYPQLRGRNM